MNILTRLDNYNKVFEKYSKKRFMQTNSEILRLHSLLFGYWQANEDIYYFGHIPDNVVEGTVEISYKKGVEEKRQYNVRQFAHGFELHISNFEYTLSKLNEQEMLLIGPLPGDTPMKFKKLQNKITYSM
jgi:hypothetical protein